MSEAETIAGGEGHVVAGLDRESSPEHLVRYCEDGDTLSAAVAKFVGDGISAGDSVVVIAIEQNRREIVQRLDVSGADLARASASGRLTFLDAHEVLSKLMRDGEPDSHFFEREVAALIARNVEALSGSARLRVYGEMADVLWQIGHRRAALRMEELWNDLERRHGLTLLSAYRLGSFYKEHLPTALPPDDARLAHEIARREEMEQALRESLRELRRKEEALRASEEQLKDFVENAAIGLHRVGPDGTILWANRAELELLGYAEQEYVGRSIAEFHADQDAIVDILDRLRRGETLHSYEARLRAKDGSIKHVLISSNVYSRDGEFVHTRCFTRDITARRNAEEALRVSQRQMELITDSLPVLVAYIGSDRRYRFVNAAYERWFGHPKTALVGRHVLDVLGADAYRAVLPYMERALSGDTVRYESELAYQAGGTRWIEATYIPQRAEGGEVIGFIGLVADITARKKLEEFRAAAAERAARLLRITSAIADAVTAEQVFEALVDRLASALDASSVGLWLLDEDGSTARLARSVGYSDSARRELEVMRADQTPSVPALDSIRWKQPVWIASQAELLERYPHLRELVTAGRSYRVACLPILGGGRVLGTLAVSIEAGREARDDERDFLLLVARYASQAIERLRLLEAERRSREAADAAALRLGALSHASRAFVEADLDLESRLDGVVSALGAMLSSAVGIALVGPDGRLHTSAVHHPDPDARRELKSIAAANPLRPGEGVTGAVVECGKSVLIPSIEPGEIKARAAGPYSAFLERFPAYAMMCAPLRVGGRTIGAVTATRTTEGETYSGEDLRLLEQLADRAAAAIDNSRLYQETLDARARSEELYRFAQSVVDAENVEEVFDAALDAIEAALGTKRAAVLTFAGDEVMRFRRWRHLSERYRAAVEGHSPWPADATAPEPVLVPDALGDPAMAAYAPLFRSEGIGALAFIPLVTSGRLLGKFMVYYDAPHEFRRHEVEMVQAIANHLASVTTRFQVVAKLEETIRYNELFAGVLAHDLRNPLGAMMNAAQLVMMRREGLAEDRESKPLSRILTSGERMTTMIDQLLDFTRARSGGGIEVVPHDTNLADLCAQAVGELELAHPEWNIRREITGDQRGTWDSDRLLQVFSNLVANAGQHGRRGEAISIRLDGTARDVVKIHIHNEGAIPEPLVPYIFDPFRSTRHRRDQSRGLGLGLFIVREIVRAHGGTVDLASSEAAGTTFSIGLPRHARGAAPT